MTTRRCAGCGADLPALIEYGPTSESPARVRSRRRDARYHSEKCRRQARYLNDLIREARLPGGKELPDWAFDAMAARHKSVTR